MNFLCHFYVADKTDTDFAGAIAADFVRGDLSHWPEPLRTGMRLHRQVDSLVDHHPITLALKQQFQPQHRRVAGVLLDMAFDHHLAQQFQQWHSLSLDQFSQICYQQLLNSEQLPEKLRHIAPRIASENWLIQYQQAGNINRALLRMAQRLRQPQRLIDAIDEIWRLDQEIALGFNALMPQVITHSQHWLTQYQQTKKGQSKD